jgi:AraC-like DNA-binding protein
MRYFVSENKNPLTYVSSGNLLHKKGFLHPKRNIDTFVIVICIKGTVYFMQDGHEYTLNENQYLILFAGHDHQGFKACEAPVSYYWCHFSVEETAYRIVNKKELLPLFSPSGEHRFSQYYVLPEYGNLADNGRAIQIFRQLLDIARGNHYSGQLPNYALSLLAMEISNEFIEQNFSSFTDKEINPNMEKVIEWIRVNYNLHVTLEKMARTFNYSHTYLTVAFHKYSGISLMKYITKVRIENAKKSLLQTSEGINEIAWKTGFSDEKVFMKRFKQLEGMTPTKYRNAFSRTKVVK